jgi:phenylalanyl-tRNA synthetase beta chain
MRTPIDWLHEYCRPDLSTAGVADRLTMTGTNVEAIHHHGVAALSNFVVGRVLEAERHPNADRLSVCVVDVGAPEPTTIVCGAPNVAAGQTVAVGRPGAIMPDGSELGRAKLRGIESDGMILAEDELAISTDHDETIVLDNDDLIPGSPLAGVLPISTDVLELEITSNRPDCLSIYGVARELHAATGAPLSAPPWAEDPGTPGEVAGAAVEVQCPERCLRFTARLFTDVKIGPSPLWLKARLMAAGQRPISNVVDITNYVMLLTGQALHAFDLDRVVGGKLTVRMATDGEQVTTLDGQTRTLDDQMVLIADEEGPTSIAGVMGGERSEVQEGTTRVLMEAATWDGPTIHHTAWTLGLQSEASHRFEKQLQPEQTIDAQAVATQLMIELCGATLSPGTIDVGASSGPPAAEIRLREARIEGLLGRPIEKDRAVEILQALEFRVAWAVDGLEVAVPYFRRGDVSREADLIEEVARIDGLDKLPATLPSRHGASGRLTPRQRLRRRAADALTAQGLHEIVGWSFTGVELFERLGLGLGHVDAVELANPMSGDQSLLRTTLVGSLLDAAARNRARGAGTVRLFEAGAVYLKDAERSDGLPREPYHFGGLLIGPVRPATWRDAEPRNADFYAAKGVLHGLMETLRTPYTVEPPEQPEPFLHPGRSAQILVSGELAGWLGEIHPLVAERWEVGDTVAGFELDLDLVAASAPPIAGYEDLTSFPAVREDLAVIVSDEISAADVLATVQRAGAPLLTDAEVFDVYRDPERIGEGNVSLALRLTYRADDRTLTDAEVAKRRRKIADALASELSGRVRDA